MPQPRHFAGVNGRGFRALVRRDVLRFFRLAAESLGGPCVSSLLFMAGLCVFLGVPPMFERFYGNNVLRWDFRLRRGSPLINAGDPLLLDANGTTSDMGAYGGPYAD